MASPFTSQWHASTMCESCRSRNSRCDGTRPKCWLCTQLNFNCIYRDSSFNFTIDDHLILERFSHVEGLPQPAVSSNPSSSIHSPATSSSTHDDHIAHRSNDITFLNKASASTDKKMSTYHHRAGPNNRQAQTTTPSSSSSAALIEELLSHVHDAEVLLQIEINRDPIGLESAQRPDFRDSLSNIRGYFEKLNKHYPCINPLTWSKYYNTALSQGFCKGSESCIVLLVIALGDSIPQNFEGDPPGWAYFGTAWSLLPKILLRNDLVAVQSQVLAALYLMLVYRHLEAWNVLANASLKLQLLMRTSERLSNGEEELGSRVYWSAVMIENDLLAELDLPQTGLSRLEKRFPLPLAMEHLERSTAIRDESHYFLADVTLRRIQTQISATLRHWKSQCSKSTTENSITQLDLFVQELDQKLHKWYTDLPPGVKFSLQQTISPSSAQTVLRLRYFACCTITFQPYVLLAFQDESFTMFLNWRDKCRRCLEACIRQLEHITLHSSSYLPYLYLKTFSVASLVFLIMSASLSPSLSQMLPPSVQTNDIIVNVVLEIERYAHVSPSLRLSAQTIREANLKRQIWLNRLILGSGRNAMHTDFPS